MKIGDTVKIMKPDHPMIGHEGVVMGVEWLDTEDDGPREVAEVAGVDPIVDLCGVVKVFPIYVIRLMWLDVVRSCDPVKGRELAQRIAVAVYEDRRLTLFPELIEYPNPVAHITG